MTEQSPRIYTYKITFDEVPYYYYGVHKEKVFGEEYLGTPITHKWCWDFYTPKKQILQVFLYTDDGWLEALEVEKRLIMPVYHSDKWCLNESCGGQVSLDIRRRNGQKAYELGIGIYKKTIENIEKRKEIGRKTGKKTYELGIGVHGRSREKMIEDGKKGGKNGGRKTYELGVGLYAIPIEDKVEVCRKGGKVGGRISSSQKWICLETGFITNAGNLTKYQKAKGIDTSKRKRIL